MSKEYEDMTPEEKSKYWARVEMGICSLHITPVILRNLSEIVRKSYMQGFKDGQEDKVSQKEKEEKT